MWKQKAGSRVANFNSAELQVHPHVAHKSYSQIEMVTRLSRQMVTESSLAYSSACGNAQYMVLRIYEHAQSLTRALMSGCERRYS